MNLPRNVLLTLYKPFTWRYKMIFIYIIYMVIFCMIKEMMRISDHTNNWHNTGNTKRKIIWFRFTLTKCDVLRDLISLVQFKKREKTQGGVLLLVKLLLHGCLSRFLNCANGTKLHNASQMIDGIVSSRVSAPGPTLKYWPHPLFAKPPPWKIFQSPFITW